MLGRIHLRNLMPVMALFAAAGSAHAQTPAQSVTPLPAPAPTSWSAPRVAAARKSASQAAHASEDKSGAFSTRNGLRLKLATEMGSVRVFTDAVGQVRYLVHIEADAAGPDAYEAVRQFQIRALGTQQGTVISGMVERRELRGRLWVTYELHVPRDYNLDVSTQAGNIQVNDIDGRVSLVTQGGNITAGRVGGGARQAGALVARLESVGGGHISVGDVNGDLRAVTAGGHITVGNVAGDAVLSTGGGHIQAGSISGAAQLDTGGGNISVERAGSRVTASSTGGQITFGEAAGAIQAHSAGGGVRVLHVSGPMQLDSSGGSIFLTSVNSSVHASAGAGSITAWLSPSLKVASSSQLESAQGDIIVYVPRELHVTIEATIDTASGHRIVSDPSLPMKITYLTGESGKQMRGECAVNGGGEVLHLRAVEGNIQLRFADETFLHQQQLMQDQIRQAIQMQQNIVQTYVLRQKIEDAKRQTQQAQDYPQQVSAIAPTAQPGMKARTPPSWVVVPGAPAAPVPSAKTSPSPAPTEALWTKLGELWWGGVRVDTSEEEKRLVHQVRPVYPDVAQQSGIEGTVSMQVRINEEGAVERVNVLSGETALQGAAMDAVKQWRYQPFVLEGKAVPVITIINLEFRLQ